jgi:hypothetical protein
MATVRPDEAQKRFADAIVLEREDVDAAMDYFVARVESPTDSELLLRRWWRVRRTPPKGALILDEDYEFEVECQRAAAYWISRLTGALALYELVKGGWLATDSEQFPVAEVNQQYTTITPESGSGSSGGFHLDKFRVPYPARVRPPVVAKSWTRPERADSSFSQVEPVASQTSPMGVIKEEARRIEALDALAEVARMINQLIESGELSPENRRLLEGPAQELLGELLRLLQTVVATERERRGLVARARDAVGETIGVVRSVTTLAAPMLTGLANAPAALDTVYKILQGIQHSIG